MTEYQDVLNFWFEEVNAEQWYTKDDAFDREIWDRFSTEILAAKAGELWPFRKTLKGRLAEIIILDQFSRNVFRGDAKSFSSDDMALTLAQEILEHEDIETLSTSEKQFLFMPFMHSESLHIHEEFAIPLFKNTPGLEESYRIEKLHKAQIEKFGRYPFRNEAIGRESTEEEIAFMNENKNF